MKEKKLAKCPDHLTGEARKEWGRITRELDALGLMATTDRAAVGLYCEQFRQWSEAVGKVAEQGMVVKMPNGWPAPNPYLAIVTKTTAAMGKLLAEFGCTPRSRSQAKPQAPAEDDEDKIDF